MKRPSDIVISVTAFLIGMGVAGLILAAYIEACMAFFTALLVLASAIEPSCTRQCGQGRHGCVCRGMAP